MSFSTRPGQEVAIVKGGSSDGEIVYLKDKDSNESKLMVSKPIKEVEVIDGEFMILPNKGIRVIYIVGPSGSGKSTVAANYIKRYRKENPKSGIFVFSQLTKDPVLDKLKIHRVTLDESLADNPIDIETDIKEHDLILFDDCSDISDDKIQKAVDSLETRLLVHGRKMDIKVIITSHLLTGSSNSKHMRSRLNEMQMLVFFPQAGSTAQLTYGLKTQFGLSTRQTGTVLAINSRWVALTKTYPNILISEHLIKFLKDF